MGTQIQSCFISMRGQDIFVLKHLQIGSGTHQAAYSSNTLSSCQRVKPLGHQAYNSPPSTAKVKNEWNSTSVPILLQCIVPPLLPQYGTLWCDGWHAQVPYHREFTFTICGSLQTLKTTTLSNTVSFHILSDSQFNSTFPSAFPVATATTYK